MKIQKIKKLFFLDFMQKSNNGINFFYRTDIFKFKPNSVITISFTKTNKNIDNIVFEIFESNYYENRRIVENNFEISLQNTTDTINIYYYFTHFTMLSAYEEIGEIRIQEEN